MARKNPPPCDLTTAGGRLHSERQRMQLSIKDAASIAGVSVETLTAWENSTGSQSVNAITALGKAGLDILFFMTGETTPERLAGVTVEEAMSILSPADRHHLIVYLLINELSAARRGLE